MNQKTLKAIRRATTILGGTNKTARLLGVYPPNVSNWITGVRPVPWERCVEIERATNGLVRREQLNPKIKWHLLERTAA